MNRQARPKRSTEVQIRQRYQIQYNHFIEEEFSYNSHALLKRICENGQKQPYMFGVPLYKITLQVVKIMMMNELQIMFLGSTLHEMRWSVGDPCLNDYYEDAFDITPKLQKDKQSRRVQLGLILIAYIVKIYLNEQNAVIDFKIRDIIKTNFDKMYQVWVQKVQNNFKFNPKNINRLFKQLEGTKNDKKYQIVDYNKLVAQFFRQNDGQNMHEQKIDVEPQPHYQPIQRHVQELPIEEQIEPYNYSMRLTQNKVSQVGLRRIQSGNQFFEYENKPKERGMLYKLQLVGKNSLTQN